MADKLLKDCDDVYDVIALPGGMPGATNFAACPLLIQKLKEQIEAKRFVAAICASPAVVLEAQGLLFVFFFYFLYIVFNNSMLKV